MKNKLMAVLLALCLLAGLAMPALAADPVYFTAINDTVLPLKSETMPKYVGDTLYLPYTFFSSSILGVYYTNSSDLNTIMVYASSTKRLVFNVSRSTVYDQSGQQYFFSARALNGTVYLPAQKVCDFFGLTLSVIETDLAPIVRVKTSAAILNDRTFPFYSRTKTDMQTYYNDYTGVAPSPEPTPDVSPTPTEPGVESYAQVTVYLSFHKFADGMLEKLLNTADDYGYKCSIFVAADEIKDNADVLRRAAGEGHTIGIWLKDGTYDEYRETARLLYEAAKVRTILIASPTGTAGAAKATAKENGLLYWSSTRRYDETKTPSLSALTSKLVDTSRRSESFCFASTSASLHVVDALLEYLSVHSYTVRKITETTVPTLPPG
jgi:hypothetical protein